MIKYTGAKQYIFVSMLKQVAKKMEYKDVLIYHTSFCVILIIEWLRTFHNKSFYNTYDKKINMYNYFIKKKKFYFSESIIFDQIFIFPRANGNSMTCHFDEFGNTLAVTWTMNIYVKVDLKSECCQMNIHILFIQNNL